MYIMKELLDEFICSVTEENGIITLTYCHPTSLNQSGEGIPTFSHLTDDGGLTSYTGTCVYERHEMKGSIKPIKQKFIIMTGCDMGDIIEYIYQKRGLSEKDFNEVNILIREHSREKVDTF